MDNEAYLFHGINAPIKEDAERSSDIMNRMRSRMSKYTKEDYEGFKILFPDEDNPVVTCEDIPFGNVKERVKHYGEPDTASQLAHLEKYGWFY